MKLLQPDSADAAQLARHVEAYPDAVLVLFYRPHFEPPWVNPIVAYAANLAMEDEQRRRVVDYVRARRAFVAASRTIREKEEDKR